LTKYNSAEEVRYTLSFSLSTRQFWWNKRVIITAYCKLGHCQSSRFVTHFHEAGFSFTCIRKLPDFVHIYVWPQEF